MENRATSARVDRSRHLHALLVELQGWDSRGGPRFRLLARAIARTVERGWFDPGARLPSERSLAAALHLSRGTAVAAYDLLVADGLLERRPGSGTFVVAPGVLALPTGREGSALVHRLVESSAGATAPQPTPDLIDLSISVLADAGPMPAFRLSSADLADVAAGTGYSPWGLPLLREQLAAQLTTWGVPTGSGQVVVTTGAQQAISLAAACWLRPGDTVVVEDPTYPGAIATFRQAGAQLVGVPVDHHGVQTGPLAEALAGRPALVYLQSTLHSPTGAVLSEHRRQQVAELVLQHRTPLVEDLALAGLAWGSTPAPIAARCGDEPVAVVGSLSKRFWGGLRVGWARAPETLALRLARVKATHDLGSSAVSQVVAQQLLARADAQQHHTQRAELRGRYDTLAAALRRHLPDWRWTEPEGGLSVWVQLPQPVAAQLAVAGLRHGVAVATAEELSPADAAHPDRIRLSFAPPPATLEEGVQRLAGAWEEIGPRSAG
jgi:DNA-binding transcriptional MocR family regulator